MSILKPTNCWQTSIRPMNGENFAQLRNQLFSPSRQRSRRSAVVDAKLLKGLEPVRQLLPILGESVEALCQHFDRLVRFEQAVLVLEPLLLNGLQQRLLLLAQERHLQPQTLHRFSQRNLPLLGGRLFALPRENLQPEAGAVVILTRKCCHVRAARIQTARQNLRLQMLVAHSALLESAQRALHFTKSRAVIAGLAHLGGQVGHLKEAVARQERGTAERIRGNEEMSVELEDEGVGLQVLDEALHEFLAHADEA